MAIIMIFELTLDHQNHPAANAGVRRRLLHLFQYPKRRSSLRGSFEKKGAGDYRRQLAELHVRDLVKPDPLTPFRRMRRFR